MARCSRCVRKVERRFNMAVSAAAIGEAMTLAEQYRQFRLSKICQECIGKIQRRKSRKCCD